jgi:hypothetical protein
MFGWDYPPGAANDPSAPYNQQDPPCEVCAKSCDNCICPECPVCQSNGDPACYKNHGLVLNAEQIQSQEAAKEQEKIEAAFWEDYAKSHPEEE